ncbi:MAG: hypothetical protein ABWK53_07785 [Anaerolineales bacterium]
MDKQTIAVMNSICQSAQQVEQFLVTIRAGKTGEAGAGGQPVEVCLPRVERLQIEPRGKRFFFSQVFARQKPNAYSVARAGLPELLNQGVRVH